MRLNDGDKRILKEYGYIESDYKQIEYCCNHCTYSQDGKMISRTEAIDSLGRKVWLSGIARASFHRTAMRENILFNFNM